MIIIKTYDAKVQKADPDELQQMSKTGCKT